MTVERMRREMGAGEYMLWTRFFAREAQAAELERARQQ
jgi:hypothetical protein